MRCPLIDTIAESPGSACGTAITNPLFASGCRACYSLRRAETTRLARHCCKLMSPILCMTGASADGRYRESFREACRVYAEGRSPAGGHGLAPPAAAKRTHCSVTPASPSQGGTDQSRHGICPHRELSEPSYQGLSRANANSMYERILDTARINVYKHTRCGVIFALAPLT